MKKPIVAWSHSVLELFEQCPKKYYHLKVKKDFKEEFKGKEADEGIRAHKVFEDFLCRDKPLPLDYKHHETVLIKLRDAPGKAYTEQQLCINSDFQPTGWFDTDAYGRAVLDYMKVNGTKAVLIDHKFGKMHDDFAQLQMFIAFVAIFLPEVEEFTAAYYWAKNRKFTRIKMVKNETTGIWSSILPRVQRLETAIKTVDFPAIQSGLCKRHCIVDTCPHNGGGK